MGKQNGELKPAVMFYSTNIKLCHLQIKVLHWKGLSCNDLLLSGAVICILKALLNQWYGEVCACVEVFSLKPLCSSLPVDFSSCSCLQRKLLLCTHNSDMLPSLITQAFEWQMETKLGLRTNNILFRLIFTVLQSLMDPIFGFYSYMKLTDIILFSWFKWLLEMQGSLLYHGAQDWTQETGSLCFFLWRE